MKVQSSPPQTDRRYSDPISSRLRVLQDPPLLLPTSRVPPHCKRRAATHTGVGLVEPQAEGSAVAHIFDVVARDGLQVRKQCWD